MAGLWDPPYVQAAEDPISFCLPYDVMEEMDINIKCCIHVLEILISQANVDIVEHEEELMELLSQLVCTDEVFSKMFSMSLRAKIEFLDSAIKNLKDDDEDFSSTSWEPAESLNDILKSLSCQYLQKKDLQFADNTRTALSSYCPVPADTQKQQIGSSSNANQLEKIKTVNITPVEKQTISLTIVKVEEEDTDYSLTDPVPKYSQSLCWGFTKKSGREVTKFRVKSPIIMKKDVLQNRIPKCKSICPKPSLETQRKRKHHLSIIKAQSYDESMSWATVPYDESMSLVTVPYDEHMSLTTVPYDESMSLATVPYAESFEETNAMSLTTIPCVLSNEEANAKLEELEFPPGYPKPQHYQKQSTSRSQSRYSTSTYSRRKKSNSPLQASLKSHLALVVGRPLDRADTHANLYEEDYYTVSDLQAIAREHKVKGYYKLRKAELAQLLGIKLLEGRRKQLKRRETANLTSNDKVSHRDC